LRTGNASLRLALALAAVLILAGVGDRVYRHYRPTYGGVLAAQSAPPLIAASTALVPGTAGASILPWVYSELWSDASPFRKTVAQQKAAGVTVVDHAYMDTLWNQGIATDPTASVVPIYVARPSDPLLKTVCTGYGGNCDAKDVLIHVPVYTVAQQAGDGHVTVIDEHAPSGRIEVDCWQTVISGTTFSCTWAGLYALGGLGLDNGGEGVHGGMAVSTVFLTAQELINGHIDHPLGIDTHCLNDPMLFPSNINSMTDTTCDGSRNPPHYGNLVHLLLSAGQIAHSAYSAPCKVVLTALATYGAYLDDTGNNGLEIHVQNELSYTANPETRPQDPWPGIQAQLDAAGDGSESRWKSCLNRLKSSDFELLEIKQPRR
jgi:hypothetical protein